jgi:hypothetical protein
VDQTAVYTRNDGIVDWQYCITGDPKIDCEVNGTHIGLIFNANVYALIANRLSAAIARKRLRRVSGKAV